MQPLWYLKFSPLIQINWTQDTEKFLKIHTSVGINSIYHHDRHFLSFLHFPNEWIHTYFFIVCWENIFLFSLFFFLLLYFLLTKNIKIIFFFISYKHYINSNLFLAVNIDILSFSRRLFFFKVWIKRTFFSSYEP